MSESPHHAPGVQPKKTDSPWFWAMVFSAAGVILLLVVSPKYAARQRRLEMQYYARQEITRRQVEGSGEVRANEPPTPPPAHGELIIPLWPLVALFSAGFAVSAAQVWWARRAEAEPTDEQGRGAEP